MFSFVIALLIFSLVPVVMALAGGLSFALGRYWGRWAVFPWVLGVGALTLAALPLPLVSQIGPDDPIPSSDSFLLFWFVALPAFVATPIGGMFGMKRRNGTTIPVDPYLNGNSSGGEGMP